MINRVTKTFALLVLIIISCDHTVKNDSLAVSDDSDHLWDVSIYDMIEIQGDTLMASLWGGSVVISMDGGATWTEKRAPKFDKLQLGAKNRIWGLSISIAPHGSWWGSRVSYSDNLGETWETLVWEIKGAQHKDPPMPVAFISQKDQEPMLMTAQGQVLALIPDGKRLTKANWSTRGNPVFEAWYVLLHVDVHEEELLVTTEDSILFLGKDSSYLQPAHNISNIWFYKEQYLIVTRQAGVYTSNSISGKRNKIAQIPDISGKIHDLEYIRDRVYIVAPGQDKNFIVYINGAGSVIEIAQLNNESMRGIIQDSKGRIWLYGHGGIFRLKEDSMIISY